MVIEPDIRDAYVELLKQVVTRSAFPDRYCPLTPSRLRRRAPIAARVLAMISPLLRAVNLTLCSETFNQTIRNDGRDWPAEADTMIGLKRLESLERSVREVLKSDIPGDLIETGVWRGGACILMRAILKAYGNVTRTVWVADSFEGLPKPNPAFPADKGNKLYELGDVFAVPLEEVRRNFERFGLLDKQVRFLPGWFRDTLPNAPIDCLSVLRLDGDLYESTMDALRSLYHKVSVGGYIIVDDYGAFPACKQAVDDFRNKEGITDTIEYIDWTGVFWRKELRSTIVPSTSSSLCISNDP